MVSSRRVIDHLRNVGRMVADPLEVLGNEKKVRRLPNVVRVFHHVRQQRAENRVVEVVDRLVAFADADGGLGIPLDEGAKDVGHHVRRDPRHLRQKRERFDVACAVHLRHALGDVLGIVANALHDARDLQRRDGIAKITRHRRPERDQLDDPLFRLNLEAVDLLVALDDPKRAFVIALDEAPHRLADGFMRLLAHFADEPAEAIDVIIEGLERMAGLLLHVRSDQPYRPVI